MSRIDNGYRIGLSRGSGPISRLIKRETRSEYSHGYLLTSARIVVESVAWHGCRVRRWEPNEMVDTDYFGVADRSLDQWQAVEDYMRDAVTRGVRYDYRAIIRWMIKLPMGENNKAFCTELLEAGAVAAGDPLFRCEPQYVSPRDHSICRRLYPLPP